MKWSVDCLTKATSSRNNSVLISKIRLGQRFSGPSTSSSNDVLISSTNLMIVSWGKGGCLLCTTGTDLTCLDIQRQERSYVDEFYASRWEKKSDWRFWRRLCVTVRCRCNSNNNISGEQHRGLFLKVEHIPIPPSLFLLHSPSLRLPPPLSPLPLLLTLTQTLRHTHALFSPLTSLCPN